MSERARQLADKHTFFKLATGCFVAASLSACAEVGLVAHLAKAVYHADQNGQITYSDALHEKGEAETQDEEETEDWAVNPYETTYETAYADGSQYNGAEPAQAEWRADRTTRYDDSAADPYRQYEQRGATRSHEAQPAYQRQESWSRNQPRDAYQTRQPATYQNAPYPYETFEQYDARRAQANEPARHPNLGQQQAGLNGGADGWRYGDAQPADPVVGQRNDSDDYDTLYAAPDLPTAETAGAPWTQGSPNYGYEDSALTEPLTGYETAAAPLLDGHFVQIGAFLDPMHAEELRLLADTWSGGRGTVSQYQSINGVFQRVRLGPFATEAEAVDALRLAQTLGHIDAMMVRP
ncbi:MAG: SPOR domain-containing protein [Neomegalonema sp.]